MSTSVDPLRRLQGPSFTAEPQVKDLSVPQIKKLLESGLAPEQKKIVESLLTKIETKGDSKLEPQERDFLKGVITNVLQNNEKLSSKQKDFLSKLNTKLDNPEPVLPQSAKEPLKRIFSGIAQGIVKIGKSILDGIKNIFSVFSSKPAANHTDNASGVRPRNSGSFSPSDNRLNFPSRERIPQVVQDNTRVNTPKFSNFSSPDNNFSGFNIPGLSSNSNLSSNVNNFYVTQNGNNLASGGGDCGPACASMVLKNFGILPPNKSSADSINTVRSAVNVTSARDGKWAIDEAEVRHGIEKLSGGAVRQVGKSEFGSSQGNDLRSYLKNQINNKSMPILETGSPYGGTGRHYMIALEVKGNGNIVVADPGGKGQWEITPEKLQQMMQKASGKGGTQVLAFNKVN